MNFEEFAELNEEFLERTPTQMIKKVSDTDLGNSANNIFKIWSKTYPNNGVGEASLIKRLAEYYDVDDYTLVALAEMHGGLPEALYEFEQVAGDNNIVSIDEVATCLYAECREEALEHYFTLYEDLTALGRKWLTAFVLRKTRNGTDESTVKKMLAKSYGFKAAEIKKAGHFMNMDNLIDQIVDFGDITFTAQAGHYMAPMLAKGGDFTVRGRRYCDYKYDGIRAQIHHNDGTYTVFNRKGDDITNKFTDIVDALKEKSDPVDWIVDGEIYPITDDGGPAEFKHIMSRIHGKTDEVIFRQDCTVKLFDCLMYGGQPVFEDDLDTRLQTLQMHFGEEFIANTKEINSHDEMMEFYEEAIAAGFEGVIVKDPTTAYDFGKRSKGWLKYKPPMVDIDCVITNATLGSGKRAGVYGSYEISIADGEELVSFGSVGTGFTEDDLTFMTNLYNKLGANNIIIEVRGDMVTQTRDGEYGLRFPRFVKYRDDKDKPTDISEIGV